MCVFFFKSQGVCIIVVVTYQIPNYISDESESLLTVAALRQSPKPFFQYPDLRIKQTQWQM